MNFFRLILLLFLFASSPAKALESDADQPIYIESNSAFYDEKTGKSIYTGDVIFKQGTLHIKADKIEAFTVKGELEKAIAYGNPVQFRQIPKPGKEEIRGTSKRAEYYVDRDTIVLIGDAVVHQGDNTYASDWIEYDQIKGTIKAGEKTSDTKRVKIILHPKNGDKNDKSKP
ncbi:MAG: hypothetical protein AXA67_10070 [Methylothermaceae bacteria B42]|nr:MAG: hypothetical protein AXA67_10070 [Methylothermaceae bacteria B42]